MRLVCREIVVKISVASPDKKSLVLFSKEIAQAATGMAPGITGIVGGRPTVWPKIRLFSCLVPKSDLEVSVKINDETLPVTVDMKGGFQEPESRIAKLSSTEPCDGEVPLIQLAWARSGDKGNHSKYWCNCKISRVSPLYSRCIE